MNLDSAFDRAHERMVWSSARWSARYEACRSEVKQLEAGLTLREAGGGGGAALPKTLGEYADRRRRKALERSRTKVSVIDWEAKVEKSKRIVERVQRNQSWLDRVTRPELIVPEPNRPVPSAELRSGSIANLQTGGVGNGPSKEQLQQKQKAVGEESEDESEYEYYSSTEEEEDEIVKSEERAKFEEVKKREPQNNASNFTRAQLASKPLKTPPAAPTFSKLKPQTKTSVDLKLSSKNLNKKDLSWLNPKEDNLIMDSMFITLKKWLDLVTKWSSDPLEGVKGKASGSVLAGTKPTDPYPRLRDELYLYEGETNFFDKPHGKGTVSYDNGDIFTGEFKDGLRHGYGTLKVVEGPKAYLDGNYVRDRLEGKGKIEYRNGDCLYAWFSSGTLHGYGKLFDKDHNLLQVGWYSNGKLTGLVWQFLVGGSCLTGEVDQFGNMLGDNITYLYPDFQTALQGYFIKGKMTMAQTCFIQLVSIRNEICHIKFTQPRGPTYKFDEGTEEIICKEPLLPDPYESQYIYIRTSRMKGANEGLFTKKDIPKDFFLCFYNGVKLRSDELDDDKEDWEANAYKIVDLQGEDEDGNLGILDIPPQYVSLKNYQASLAHKANHSFQPNAKFSLFDHPRFGKVPAVKSIVEIPKDTEVLVSYDYAMDEAPPWYQELFTQRIMNQYRASRNWNF